MNAPATFPVYDPGRHYGALGFSGRTERHYQADMIELAIRADSLPMIEEAIARGWLAPECRAFNNSPIIAYCEMRGAARVAAHLHAMGWPR